MMRKPKPLPEMLTARQAAKRKGVVESAVRKALATGRLAGQKMGTVWMIRVDDLEAWKVERGPAMPPIEELHLAVRKARLVSDSVARGVDTRSPELMLQTIPAEMLGDQSDEALRAAAAMFRERARNPIRQPAAESG